MTARRPSARLDIQWEGAGLGEMGLRGLPRGARSNPRRRLTGCRLCGNIALAAAAALFRDSSTLRATSNLNSAEEREAAQQAGAPGTRDAGPGRDGCGPPPSGPHCGRAGGLAQRSRVCAAGAPGPAAEGPSTRCARRAPFLRRFTNAGGLCVSSLRRRP